MASLKPINLPADTSTVSSDSPITIATAPGTDLWRKPPSTNSTNAPAYVTYKPLSSFRRARVTVSAEWVRLYDQGGLVFYLPGAAASEAYQAWVKTGIEMFDGKPNVGTVATPPQGYSDWSLVPTGATSVTIEAVRQSDGPALYIYLVEGEKKSLIRETTWVFHGSNPEALLGVGVYAARPTKLEGESDSGESLTVHFKGLEIEWDN
ncbi:hypothetical protein RhiJN_07219 [Ceratobasidium sp. AG-Ba]|nr:hypothetical protein RhiJN_07219 [Ceratobasidium sp. AG-Ba]QRW08090.1 hypothetical protein RhiLY_07089 [Ceratobasidium sp. AG-Ba]